MMINLVSEVKSLNCAVALDVQCFLFFFHLFSVVSFSFKRLGKRLRSAVNQKWSSGGGL